METKIKLTDGQLASFCDQMYLIVSSSIHIVGGMESLIEGFTDGVIKERLLLTKESLEGNNNLSYSLLQSGLFPEYMTTMIEIGEASGKTDQVLQSLSSYYRKQDKLKKQIKTAITYPLVIALMVVIIMSVLVVKVLPIFSDVFANLGGNVPAAVTMVTNTSKIIVFALCVIFIVFVGFVGSLLIMSRTAEGKEKTRKVLVKTPIIKKIYHRLQTAQFANSMSMLVSSGYDLHKSLELSEKIIEENSYKNKIRTALEELDLGQSLSDVLANMDIFKGIHAQVVKLGVQTGQLDLVLEKLSEEYMEDVEDGIEKAIDIIEPTLVGVTAFIIGGILLTVMLPLLGIMSSI